jgi:hypothetical protein
MRMTKGKEKLRAAHVDRLVWLICIAQIMLALTSVSCDIRSNGAGRNNTANVPTASPSPSMSIVKNAPPVATNPSPASPIRKIDFKNFTYPWYPTDSTPPHGERKITLRDGEMKVDAANNTDRLWASLANVSYADLTGDGQEEAIVTVTTNFDPNGSVASIFVYTLRGGEPKLLWSHETGDRADGGLRSLRVEGFDLVVEQYDIKFDRAKGSYEEGTALCCPKRFIRSHYRWDGEHFEKSKSETLPNEYDNARFLGYPSDQPGS